MTVDENAFTEREPFKKRVITVSITAEQRKQFDALKAKTRTVTDGAMIKKALEQMIDRESINEPDVSESATIKEKK